MNMLRTALSRYRLLGSALALALMLTALSVKPPSSKAFECEGGMICGQGCVGWNIKDGCWHCQVCCACGEDYMCNDIQDRGCAYTYE
jgi:hypothetical protein